METISHFYAQADAYMSEFKIILNSDIIFFRTPVCACNWVVRDFSSFLRQTEAVLPVPEFFLFLPLEHQDMQDLQTVASSLLLLRLDILNKRLWKSRLDRLQTWTCHFLYDGTLLGLTFLWITSTARLTPSKSSKIRKAYGFQKLPARHPLVFANIWICTVPVFTGRVTLRHIWPYPRDTHEFTQYFARKIFRPYRQKKNIVCCFAFAFRSRV